MARTTIDDSTGYRTITAAQEIGRLRDGVAVLRILQAHGINHLARHEGDPQRGESRVVECTSIDRMIDDARKASGF